MLKYLTSSPSMFIIIEGDAGTVEKVKQRAVEIRGKYGTNEKMIRNVVHASNSNESAQREIDFVIESMSRGRL